MPIIFRKEENFILKKILAIPLLMFAFVSIMAVDLSAQETILSLQQENITSLPSDLSGFKKVSYYHSYQSTENITYSKIENETLIIYIDNSNGYGGTGDLIITKDIESTLSPNLIDFDYHSPINNLKKGDLAKITINDMEQFAAGNYYIAAVEIDAYQNNMTLVSSESVEITKSPIETIFKTISAVVGGGIGIIGALFTGESTIINVFWTPATETVSGSLTMFGVLSLLTFGFGLVVFALRKILKLLKMRS